MKRLILLVGIISVSCLISQTYSQETNSVEGTTFASHNKISLGINDLPWDATRMSFRWWKNEKSGRELAISSFRLLFGNIDGNTVVTDGSISGFRYIWLKRSKIGEENGLFLSKGIGLSFSFSYRYSKYQPDYETKMSNISANINIPIGIEHFFIKKFSNISYSLEADFYGGVMHEYRLSIRDGDKTETEYPGVNFGVTPRFYIRWYFNIKSSK